MSMEERTYKYNAFISYRHTELDMYVAENLIKQLEAYKLPGSVAKKLKGKHTKIKRIFRDREELPLTNNLEEPIMEALEDSEWLLVICSPRLPESMWCKKEIETFISLRGREHVLAILIEGEPEDSFPEELLYRTIEVEKADGTKELIREAIEPLAADFRGKDGTDKKGVAKAMKTEILRVLAAMFGVEYDDLRQRHRERKMRRIVTAALLTTSVCLAFGVYSTMTALRIKEQKERIELQSEQILKQSQDIQAKSDEILKQNEEITRQNEELAYRQALALAERATGYYEEGDRERAAITAIEAITESAGIKMPYTPEAQYILTDALRVYDTGADFKAQYQYEMSGKIKHMDISPDRSVVSLTDATGSVVLFDLAKREEIATIINREAITNIEKQQVFLEDGQFAYIDSENEVCIYDIAEKKVIERQKSGTTHTICTDDEGKYLFVYGYDGLYEIYSADTLERIETIEEPENADGSDSPYVFSEGIFADVYYAKEDYDKKEGTLYFRDIESGRTIYSYAIEDKSVEDIQICNGVAYVLISHTLKEFSDYDTYIVAISMENGKLLWEKRIPGELPNELYFPPAEEGKELICTFSGELRLIDISTGENTCVIPMDTNIIEVYPIRDAANWYFIMENGQFLRMNRETGLFYDMSERLQCKSSGNNAYAFVTAGYGVVFLENGDKKITVYTTECGPDVKEISEEVTYPEIANRWTGKNATDMAQFYEVERAEYVDTMYQSADGKYCIIHYGDGDLAIFDAQQKKILNVIEDAELTSWYLGADEKGYTYLLGYGGCYILDKNMKPVAWIEDVQNVDIKKGMLYMVSIGKNYEAPIYTLEELLEIANKEAVE